MILDKETIKGWQRIAVLAHTIDSRLSKSTLFRENKNNLDDLSVYYVAKTDKHTYIFKSRGELHTLRAGIGI